MKFLFNIFLILFFFSSVSAKDHLQFFIDAALKNNLKLNAERKNQKSIKENINMEDMAEVIFLTKYLGDYNINKYGEDLVLENQGYVLKLRRI